MDYSLWRGNTELGRIRLPLSSDDPHLIHGMLEVTSSLEDVQSVQQTRFHVGDGARVFEHALPDLDALKATSRQRASSFERIGPRVLSPEEAMGVPIERILELRDSQGRVVATDMIMVTRLPEAFTRNARWIARCAEASVPMSPWSVGARCAQSEE